jgi:hypothetical protein
MRYVFNYGSEPSDISSLIDNRTLLLGQATLEPCGVAAARLQ